jgi:hypothetical protein
VSAVNRILDELLEEKLIIASAESPEPPIDEELPRTEREPLRFHTPTLAKFTDMQDLLLLDPIHDVDKTGWPARK